MCGIFGIASAHAAQTQDALAMSKKLAHRGPDDEGYLLVRPGVTITVGGDRTPDAVWKSLSSYAPRRHINEAVEPCALILGHNRLSIIDTSPAGHQPMTRNREVWITFNGEIYNYCELREKLSQKGMVFTTQSDTEVLLAAYEYWGFDCLRYLNGMWAFVIYDSRKRILFGARDRFGVKPFYYFNKPGIFAFASEIKALLALSFVDKRIRHEAIFDYCLWGWGEAEREGFFKDIIELQPAHAFIYDLAEASFREWKFYTLPYNRSLGRFDTAQAGAYAQEARARIFNAVSLRLRSDVKVGSCLSGGLDSSTIVCSINALLKDKNIQSVGQQQNVFTVCYGIKPFDEREWADEVVGSTQSEWHTVYPDGNDLLADLEDLVYYQDIPFVSTTMYAQYRVMQLAQKAGVKVLLDGQGGDELFAGYTSFYRAFFMDLARHFQAYRLMREIVCLSNAPTHLPFIASSSLYLLGVSKLSTAWRNRLILATSGEARYINRDFWRENTARLQKQNRILGGQLNAALAQHMCGHELKSLLRYEDRNSMRFSIEARVPFADDINLIEYLFSIPSVFKIHDGWSKFILRQAMQGVIPKRIQMRKDKTFFQPPEFIWLSQAEDIE